MSSVKKMKVIIAMIVAIKSACSVSVPIDTVREVSWPGLINSPRERCPFPVPTPVGSGRGHVPLFVVGEKN